MRKALFAFLTIGLLTSRVTSPAFARGRHPEPEEGYPDYNKFDMRKKSSEPAKEEGPVTGTGAAPALSTSPSLNSPKAWKVEDETMPKAPPKPVYLPDDASEPPLPEAIQNTLIQGTTVQ